METIIIAIFISLLLLSLIIWSGIGTNIPLMKQTIDILHLIKYSSVILCVSTKIIMIENAGIYFFLSFVSMILTIVSYVRIEYCINEAIKME